MRIILFGPSLNSIFGSKKYSRLIPGLSVEFQLRNKAPERLAAEVIEQKDLRQV